MIYKMVCPQCNAPLEMDDTKDFMFCRFCGTKVANLSQKVEINQQVNVSGTVMHVNDRTNEPNLLISYSSSNPGVQMMVTIPSIGIKKALLMNGQEMSFRLPNGVNTIAVKIGKINYKRNVLINSAKGPVRFYASWAGRAHINIDAPL